MIRLLLLFVLVRIKLFCQKNNVDISVCRILVIQLSGIGDSILTLPLVDKLRISSKVDVLTRNSNICIYKGRDPNLVVHDYDHAVPGLITLIEFFKKGNYDLVISSRSNILILFISIFFKFRLVPNPLFESFSILDKVRSLSSRQYKFRFYSSRHVVNLFNVALKIDNFLSLSNVLKEDVPDDVKFFLEGARDVCVFHFAGSDDIRRLKPSVINEICNGIGLKVILIGGPLDSELLEGVQLNLNVLNKVGDLSLNQVSCLLALVDYAICVDSSIMHIASTYSDLKMVSIMGNSTIGLYGPYSSGFKRSDVVLHRLPNCCPCSRTSCFKYSGFSCVQDITSDEVLSAFQRLRNS